MVCIGNICRSPMAEALFKVVCQNNTSPISFSSAGLNALIDKPADPIVQELMAERGIDLSQHRSRQLNLDLLFKSDLILTMTQDQQQTLEKQFPVIKGRVQRLGKWGLYDINDPYKRPRFIFEQVLALIEQGVHDWNKMLWN